MSASPFSVRKFKWVFAGSWLAWAGLHAIAVQSFGVKWETAIIDSVISNVLLILVCLLVLNTFRYYLPTSDRYGYILAMCAILAIAWLFASKGVTTIFQPVSQIEFFNLSIYVRLAIGFLAIGSMALLSVLWYTLQDQQQNEKRKAEAEKLAREAELYKLRQQLHPHFLFNSLNSINALTGTRPAEARQMIQQLSDFLRGVLKKEENQWVTLIEELQLLELYLEIEKVRFGHRLSTIIESDPEAELKKLPALLLQPVVENAIKFGLYDTTGDITISIHAKLQQEMLVITVQNPFDPSTTVPGKGTGFGLRSVQRRLYLLFASNDLLQTQIDDHLFTTTIKVPQE